MLHQAVLRRAAHPKDKKALFGVENIPQRLKPNHSQAFMYGLKAVPFRKKPAVG
jgi:hypothetical protein